MELQKNAPIPYWVVGNRYHVLSDRWSSRGIIKGTVIEVAHLSDDGKIMVRHPEQPGRLYPFEPLELQDLHFSTIV